MVATILNLTEASKAQIGGVYSQNVTNHSTFLRRCFQSETILVLDCLRLILIFILLISLFLVFVDEERMLYQTLNLFHLYYPYLAG